MPTPLSPAETADLATSGKFPVPIPTLEPAFTWDSLSTIAVNEDNTSDLFASRTKVERAPSTPKVAPLATSPQWPSRTAMIRRTDIFSPLASTKLDFVLASASPSTPSRMPRSSLRSPRKLLDGFDKENTPPKLPAPAALLERIAMASPSTPTLGKRRASNVQSDSRPSKRKRSGSMTRKLNDGGNSDGGHGNDNSGRGIATDDDSEAEREEVRQSLSRLVTHSPPTLPRPPPRSPSPTPQALQHKRKRKVVFTDAIEGAKAAAATASPAQDAVVSQRKLTRGNARAIVNVNVNIRRTVAAITAAAAGSGGPQQQQALH